LLVVRFVLINLIAVGLLAAAYVQGWLDGIFVDNTRELSLGIFAVFLSGLIMCSVKIWRTSCEINDAKTGAPSPDSRAGKYLASIRGRGPESSVGADNLLRLKLSHRIAIVRHIADSLVFLGLIGTVIGFIIALSGVDPKAIAEVENVAPMVSTLISGMSVALYTTLVGGVLFIWLIINHRILATGTVSLISVVFELRDSDGND
jgi:hypothetical protein